jgi:hypothetical protein
MIEYNLVTITGGAIGVFIGIKMYDFVAWIVPKMQRWAADR